MNNPGFGVSSVERFQPGEKGKRKTVREEKMIGELSFFDYLFVSPPARHSGQEDKKVIGDLGQSPNALII